MSKHQVSLQVEFEKDDLQKFVFSAKTKILGGDLVALDFGGLAFERSRLLHEAIELLNDIHSNECLQANHKLEIRLRELVVEVSKL